MAESYPDPQAIPERVGGRLMLVITLELTLLLGGTYGAWRLASSRGLGIKAKPSRMVEDDASAIAFGFPGPPPIGIPAPPNPDGERLSVHFHTPAAFDVHVTRGEAEEKVVIGKLTSGRTRTTIHLDGEARELGTGPGGWHKDPQRPGMISVPDRRWIQAWDYPNKVRITQDVLLATNPDMKGCDSVVVRYLIENRDVQAHTIGLRFLLDTHMGKADGVPFAVPGARGLLTRPREFKDDQVPCFLQALEHADLPNPGTVATLTLRFRDFLAVGDDRVAIEPADRMIVTSMPQPDDWDIAQTEFIEQDSCVALFWKERRLRSRAARAVGFVYGRGKLFTDDERRDLELAVSYGPEPLVGTEFDIVAWVHDPAFGQVATIKLPDNMHLVNPKTESQPVPKARKSLTQVSWRVKVDVQARPGRHDATMGSGNARVAVPIIVRELDFEVVE